MQKNLMQIYINLGDENLEPAFLFFICHILFRSTNVLVQKISIPTQRSRMVIGNSEGVGVSIAKCLKGTYEPKLEIPEGKGHGCKLNSHPCWRYRYFLESNMTMQSNLSNMDTEGMEQSVSLREVST